ncbi:hypothetical protein HPDFL43_05950 [Hoeflea phototrophica DFL-43]|jgi:hypothetical protein|uniref:Uncharacterized protein n=1 Tax=Hoeflea phototrophica (strain DSM 17068 / NCIMB 14078 / DFL-43) TaxID=411684 RepID=A9D4W0_HOEPD|nr:hypothetical protein [Hoeflea phototrophica]EDQ33973.1 hypothetical protein HPDFL43_05950 [Hoeflea phototrophica DFL-43]
MAGPDAGHEVIGRVAAPRFAADHPDYCLECEEAVEPFLIGMIGHARDAGWEPSAIWPVLRSLVANLEEAEIENWRTSHAIGQARLAMAE